MLEPVQATSSNELALSGPKETTLIFIKQKRDRNAERSNRNSTILFVRLFEIYEGVETIRRADRDL
jgi:hypothetical protein